MLDNVFLPSSIMATDADPSSHQSHRPHVAFFSNVGAITISGGSFTLNAPYNPHGPSVMSENNRSTKESLE
jgi:hypothetical protein